VSLAFIAIDYPPVVGGISRYTGDVVLFLSRARDVSVFICARQTPAPWPAHTHTGMIDPDVLNSRPAEIAARLKNSGIDHVFFNHVDLAGPRTIRAFRQAGISCSCFFYGADINLRRTFKQHVRLYIASAMLKNRVVISKGTQAVFNRRLPGLSTRMIYPGINAASQNENSMPAREGIIAVGRLVRRKGFDVLCDAVALLKKNGLTPHVTIVGDGPDADWLKQYVSERGLSGQVIFLAGLSDEQIRYELRRHRVFCLLPRSMGNGDIEGFGIVFLEAAREGLPVVAGRSGGVPDAVSDGNNGFLVNPTDAGEVAGRLKELLTDDALWQRQSRESLTWCKEFDWNTRDPKLEFAFLDQRV